MHERLDQTENSDSGFGLARPVLESKTSRSGLLHGCSNGFESALAESPEGE
jgi:hypothetical protein